MIDNKNIKDLESLRSKYKGLTYILFIVCWYWDTTGFLFKGGLTSDFQLIKFSEEDCNVIRDLEEYIWSKCPFLRHEHGVFAFHIDHEMAYEVGNIFYGDLDTIDLVDDDNDFYHYSIDFFDNYKAILDVGAKVFKSVEDVLALELENSQYDEGWYYALFTNPSLPLAYVCLHLYDPNSELHIYALEHLKLFPERKELL